MRKVRANKITIETPREGSEPWIRVDVQLVEKDGEIYNVTDRWDSFNYRMSDIATTQYPIVTDVSDGFFSMMDIGTHITLVVSMWLAEKYNGVIDPETGDVIIEE